MQSRRHTGRDNNTNKSSRAREPRRQALVIETDGIQGFLVARALDKEWEIENMAVSGPARRHGLGTRLLGEFLDRVRVAGAQGVFLEVRESNHAARALYENGPSSKLAAEKGTTGDQKRTQSHIVWIWHDLLHLLCKFCD